MMKKRSKRRLFHGDMAFTATSASQGHGFVAITFFLLLLSLFSLHSAEKSISNCTSFNCGPLKNITYPFYNNSNSNCGLSSIKCESNIPIIKFMEFPEKWFKVEKILYENQMIIVQDLVLSSSFNNNKTCPLALHNFERHLKAYLLPLEVKSPILTLFTCNRSIFHASHSQLVKNLYSYDGCTDYYIFFYNASNQNQSLPSNCQVYHIPVAVSKELPPFNGTNLGDDYLESLFARGFQLQWILPHPPGSADTKNELQNLKIGLSAGAGAIVLICFFCFLIYRFRNRKLSSSSLIARNVSSDHSSNSNLEKAGTYLGLPIFTYSELVEATDNFNPSKELGDGGFGTVYHGKLRDERAVAVKRLYESNHRRVEQFMNEVEILTRLRHPNLVTLYGCTSRRSRELLLVYEFIPNGTIADHLHGDRAKPGSLTWPIRMSIAIETASALAYLHASDIIHRDVKTNNILLDDNFCVKVADFGLSRFFPTDVTHVSTIPQGTPGYVDPEYHQCYQLTNKSDVYSFGVVLIELISSKPAVDINRHRNEIKLANMALNMIQNGLLHELVDPYLGFEEDYMAKRMIEVVAELAFRCLQHEKEMRPSMNEVLEVLKGIESQNCGVEKTVELNITDDHVGLLKNSLPPCSPNSVADKWISRSTTPSASS